MKLLQDLSILIDIPLKEYIVSIPMVIQSKVSLVETTINLILLVDCNNVVVYYLVHPFAL